jgi:hypothetical protein
MAVLLDADGLVVAVRPVDSIDEGEAALTSLLSELTCEHRPAV